MEPQGQSVLEVLKYIHGPSFTVILFMRTVQ